MLPIIVVDDDPFIAEVVSFSVEDSGFGTPEVFASAREVISWARQNTTPFVLFTDYRMPGMNGMELIEELHRQGMTVHAVLVTGAVECIDGDHPGIPVLEKSGPDFPDRLQEEIRKAHELCTA